MPSVRRSIRRHISIVMLMALLLAVGNISWAAPSQHTLRQSSYEVRDLDLVLLIDESGSAWEQTDPQSQQSSPDIPPFRIQAAKYIVDLLAVEPSTPNHIVAVFFFGEDVKEVVPLTPVGRNPEAITQRIEAAHYTYGNLKWTDIDAGFQNALAVLQNLPQNPDRRSVVIMITDGRPETESANIINGEDTPEGQRYGPYLDQIRQTLDSFETIPNAGQGCEGATPNTNPVFLLGVDVQATTALAGTRYVLPENISFWSQELGNNYRPVTNFAQLNGDVANLVADLLCAASLPLPPPVPPPSSYLFTVNDNYAGVIFSVLRNDPSASVLIFPPNSTTSLQRSDPGVQVVQSSTDEIWSISRAEYVSVYPNWSGLWEVRVPNGGGTVQFGFMSLARNYRVNVLEPQIEFHPAGKPLNVTSQVVDSSGLVATQQITSVEMLVTRTAADGSKTDLPLLPMTVGPDGIYQAQIAETPPGLYTINIEATLLDGQKANGSLKISMRQLPWARLVSPRSDIPLYAADPLLVEVSAQSMGPNDPQPRPVDALVARQTQVVAILQRKSDQSTIARVVLDPETSGAGVTHKGLLPAPGDPGDYNLTIELTYTPPSGGTPFVEVPSVQQALTFQSGSAPLDATPIPAPTKVPTLMPTLAPTITPVPTPLLPVQPPRSNTWLIWLLPALLALAVIGGAIWWFSQRGPSLNGAWLDIGDGVVTLKGYRQIVQLLDSNALPQSRVSIKRVPGLNGPTGQATILDISAGQELIIDNVQRAKGDVVVLEPDSSMSIGGRTTYYRQ